MKFEDRHALARPWSVVREMFTDPAYFEQKYKLLKRTNVEILEHRKSGDVFSIRVAFDEKATIELPSYAQRFAGKTAHVIQEDRWDLKTRTGRIELDLQGLPVKIGADMKISDADGGCINVISWKVSCSVPLFGGKLEKLIAQELQKKGSEDLAASIRLLKNY